MKTDIFFVKLTITTQAFPFGDEIGTEWYYGTEPMVKDWIDDKKEEQEKINYTPDISGGSSFREYSFDKYTAIQLSEKNVSFFADMPLRIYTLLIKELLN